MPARPGEIAAAGPVVAKQPVASSRAQQLAESAFAHAHQGEFDKAIATFDLAIQLAPDEAMWWNMRATAELSDGQLDAYRRHCAEMLRYFGSQEKPAHAACDEVCKTCTFIPDAVSDWSTALALADRAVEMYPDNGRYLATRGAVLYRAGRWEEALRPLKEGQRLLHHDPNPWLRLDDARDCAYLALAHYLLGHHAEA